MTMNTNLTRAVLATAFVLGAARGAEADPSAAGRAFSNGQAAQLEGDYDRAAQSFELAHSIAPSKEALRSAVRARQQAQQLARAAMLAEVLLAEYASDATSAKLANEVIGDAKAKLARVVFACSAKCSVALSGRALTMAQADNHVLYLPPGKHAFAVSFETGSVARDVAVIVGENQKQTFEKPAAKKEATLSSNASTESKPGPEIRRTEKRGGVSPMFTLGGAVVTAGLVAAATWSGLDTNRAHEAYVANPTHEAFLDGRSKQLRTNILIGSAIGAGVVTGVIAIFWTRWSGSREAAAPISISPLEQGGVAVGWGSSF
jgi:hypothetical protein